MFSEKSTTESINFQIMHDLFYFNLRLGERL